MVDVHKLPQPISKSFSEPELAQGKKVSKKRLTNILNYVNFQNGTIQLSFKHVKYNHTVSLLAKPLPCLGEHLECVWAETPGLQNNLKSYVFEHFIASDGRKTFLIKTDVLRISEEEICFHLPEICNEVSYRKAIRHACRDIQAQLIQNSTAFSGALVDFCAVSFRIEFKTMPPQTFQWIDTKTPVTIILSDQKEILYSGECRIIKHSGGKKTRSYVLEPVNDKIPRYKPKEFRSPRQELVPSPNMIFRHPFTGKMNNLKVLDVAGSGFSVEEDEYQSVLLPGMVIPALELSFANSFKITCKAQTVYRCVLDEGKTGKRLKCGLALLDMDIEDHARLLALLQQATSRNSYICNEVDLDALWNFFFETGFIYPEKYVFLQTHKEKIKETYRKLYTENPNIARHFIYQQNGRILGHMAMVRFYENTWMIHHHAANSLDSNRAGLAVLDQISRFSNASRSLYSIHMDYLICYYRPENKFPSRVFGGLARYIKDPKGCSVDAFAYYYQAACDGEPMLPEPWGIYKVRPEDLKELEVFYENESGGIALEALDLESDMLDNDSLSEEYHRLGFKRKKYIYALKKDEVLKAIGVVCISDVGLNLSDLTNCVKIFVVDSNDLSKETLNTMLSCILKKFEQREIPVLLYPVSYADAQSVSYEKIYHLWVLNTQFGDPYYKYLKRLLGSGKY